MASPLSIHWLGTWNGAKVSAGSTRLLPWDTNKNVLANFSMAMQRVGGCRQKPKILSPSTVDHAECRMKQVGSMRGASLAPYPARVAEPIVSRKVAAKVPRRRADGPGRLTGWAGLQMMRGSKKHRLMDLRSSNRPRLHATADRR